MSRTVLARLLRSRPEYGHAQYHEYRDYAHEQGHDGSKQRPRDVRSHGNREQGEQGLANTANRALHWSVTHMSLPPFPYWIRDDRVPIHLHEGGRWVAVGWHS